MKKILYDKLTYLAKIAFVFVFLLSLFLANFSYADEKTNSSNNGNTIVVILDGKELNLANSKAIKYNNQIMLPLRSLSESMGAKVDWIAEYKTILIQKDDFFLNMPIDSDVYSTNEYDIEPDAKPLIINNSSYVTIEFLANIFNFTYEIDEITVDNKNTELLFLFTKNQNRLQKDMINNRIKKDTFKKNISFGENEINAINKLSSCPIPPNYNKYVYIIDEEQNASKYNINELFNETIGFLYTCSLKNEEDLSKYISNYTTKEKLEDLFEEYNIIAKSFLYNDKTIFSNINKFTIERDTISLYLSALEKSSNNSYLFRVDYKIKENTKELKIDNIVFINDIIEEIKIIPASNFKVKYPLIKALPKDVWALDSTEKISRTSFYIQEKPKIGSRCL